MKLTGLRVLDLSSFIPGPYLTLALADHGAEVVKIEAPDGDHGRHIGPKQGEHTTFFRSFNRGKRSLVLNLKDHSDREVFFSLAEEADVIVESSRPGVAARLGIDYEAVRSRNPRIVYCSISAFGQDGPYAHRPAHDLCLEGVSGVLSLNVGTDSQPAIPALPAADLLAGLQGLSAVLMALYARERSGQGDYIDISMHEALMSGMLNVLGPALAENKQPVAKHERTTGGSAFYRIYDTADDRQVVLGGQEMKFVRTLLGALGRMDLAPLCERGPGPHQQPVADFLQEYFRTVTFEQAALFLDALDLCWGPVNTMPEGLDDPHLAQRGFILRDAEGLRHLGSPIRFRNEPADIRLQAPALDEGRAPYIDGSLDS